MRKVCFALFFAVAGTAAAQQVQLLETDSKSGSPAVSAGDALAAIQAFSGAIALRPDSMLVWLRRGEVYRLQGDYDAAVRDQIESPRCLGKVARASRSRHEEVLVGLIRLGTTFLQTA